MGDRFIANRSAMDFGYGISMLTEKQRRTERVNRNNNDPCRCPASEEASYYRNKLAQAMNIRTRILEFNNYRNNNKNPQTLTPSPTPVDYDDDDGFLLGFDTTKHHRLRHIPQTPEKTFDAPELLDSEDLNLLDWDSNDVVSIALGWSVYLWNASDETTSELVTVDEETGPVTSVKWAPDGKHIAVGLYNSDVQLWDAKSNTLVSILRGNHASGVGALDWKNHILTTGGWDGQIINNDSRVSQHIIGTYRGHRQHVCGLKWSTWGEQLASGGTDHHLYIWDSRRITSSSNARTQWLHKLEDHTGAVRALAWCPFRDNLLASGGGEADRSIKFWKTNTGVCVNSVNTGSQVCALLWSRNERELLSSHGSTQNQLTLWKYPSVVKMAELTGHTSTVLFMAQSPDGCTVLSAAGGEDEKLLFWNVFGTPEVGFVDEEEAGTDVAKDLAPPTPLSLFLSFSSSSSLSLCPSP